MNDIDIDAIRQREDAATKGPWTSGVRWEDPCDVYWLPINSPSTDEDNRHQPDRVALIRYQAGVFQFPHADAKADAEFIAHARQDIPDLIAKVNDLTAALTEARTQAATHANEVGRLVAENARVRQDRDTKADIAKTNARVVATLTEIIERVEKFATETGGDYAQRLREVLHAPTSNEAGVAR